MMRAPRSVGELDHLGDVAPRDALGDDHDQLDAVLDRLEHRVLGERGRDGHDRAVGSTPPCVLDGLRDRVEHGHPVHLAAEAPGGDAADDLGAGAVVEALAREVDGLAAGDALDDERRRRLDQDAHGMQASRSLDLLDRPAGGLVQRHGAVGVLDAVALEDLEALLLPGAGDAEDRDRLGRVIRRAPGRP